MISLLPEYRAGRTGDWLIAAKELGVNPLAYAVVGVNKSGILTNKRDRLLCLPAWGLKGVEMPQVGERKTKDR